MTSSTVYVNCAFADQRVTGQQRYAHELSAQLPSEWLRVAPGGFWRRSRVLTWIWTLMVLPWLSRRGVLLSLTSRAPLWHPRHVLVVHDLFVLEHPEWYTTAYTKTHAPLLRWQLRSVRNLITVSEPVQKAVARRWNRSPVIAPNAPSLLFSEHRMRPKIPPGLPGLRTGRYFVVVGSQEPRKNLRTLASAYTALSDAERQEWPLVVVGGGANVYRSSEIRWPPGTLVRGYVSDVELADLYAKSGAVLLASLAEGFGLPLVEAAAAGAPRLVVSDIPVFRWICGQQAVLMLIAGNSCSVPAAGSSHLLGVFCWVASSS